MNPIRARWALAGLGLISAVPVACHNQPHEQPPIVRGAAPGYGEAVAKFNARIAPLGRLRAAAVVRIEYTDGEGKRRLEQGEGRLQVIRPDRVALDVGKLGETLLWLGCDSQRYWWIDLTGADRVVSVGRHDTYGTSRAPAMGVVVHPLDLLHMLAIVPLPVEAGGTQWSADGRLLGLACPLAGGKSLRTWVNPDDYEPRMVELFGDNGRVEVVAELPASDFVLLSNSGRMGPKVAKRARVSHLTSGSLLTLDLDDLSDGAGRIKDEAFNLDVLAERFRVARRIDLDSPGKGDGGGP